VTPIELFEKHFLQYFPRRKTTPAIRYNKIMLAKKLQAAVNRGDVTWEIIEEKVKLYAKSDTVAAGFVVLPATWCSETNDNGPGWSWEYEIQQSSEEILAAKPLSERTNDEWWEMLHLDSPFMKDFAPRHWKTHRDGPPPGSQGCMVPDEIMTKCGWRKWEKSYG